MKYICAYFLVPTKSFKCITILGVYQLLWSRNLGNLDSSPIYVSLYFLQDKPARDCFDLNIQEYFHGRNKSEITIKSCFKWTLTSESSRSGMAMLVVDIPSGK